MGETNQLVDFCMELLTLQMNALCLNSRQIVSNLYFFKKTENGN